MRLSFSVRAPKNASTNAIVMFVVGVDWPVYGWANFHFTFVASSRDDMLIDQVLLDVMELVSAKKMETLIPLPLPAAIKQPVASVFISGIHIVSVADAGHCQSYMLQIGGVKVVNTTLSFQVVTVESSSVNYAWLSYIVLAGSTANMTVAMGSVEVGWPHKVTQLNPNGSMYGQYGVVFIGLSGFDVQVDSEISISSTLDRKFQLRTATSTGSVDVSYVLLENAAQGFCQDCPDMTVLEGAYCVAQCTPDSVAVPFASFQKCVKCSLEEYRVANASSNSCKCSQNTYQDASGQCKACPYSCVTCNETGCLTCETNPNYTGRMLKSGKCICQNYRYDDGVQLACAKCHYTCLKCDGPQSNNCLACSGAAHRVLAASSCRCAVGFVDDGTHELCTPNEDQCQNGDVINGTCSCNDPYVNINGVCWQCPPNSSSLPQQTKCQCDTGTYLIRGACQGCPPTQSYNTSSKGCVCSNDSTMQSGKCIKLCSVNETLSKNNSCECKPNYARGKNGTCTKCHSPYYFNGTDCLLCSFGRINGSKCRCYVGYSFYQYTCVVLPANTVVSEGGLVCKDGYYNISGNCSKCSLSQRYNANTSKCECQPPTVRAGSQCVTLRKGQTVTNGQIVCNQKEGYYSISGTCKSCPANSFYQNSSMSCQCKPGSLRFGASCILPPIFARYEPSLLRFVCQSGYTNTSSGCKYQCKDGQQANSTNDGCQCQPGYYNISKVGCKKPGPHEFFNGMGFQCEPGYAALDAVCILKPNCTDPNTVLWLQKLVCKCGDGYYNISGKCQTCQLHSTYNGSQCACDSGYDLNKSDCSRLRVEFTPGTVTRTLGKIRVPVQLNYIPEAFLNNNCSACFLILAVNRKEKGQWFSTSFSYQANSTLVVTLDFGGDPILPFTLSLSVNPAVGKYFQPYDISATVDVPINPTKLPK